MSWIGKILGGGLGLALGGPLGAVLGATLGHTLLDSSPGASPGTRGLSGQETRQVAFFTTVFAMLGKLAKADGQVSAAEVAMVERFMVERLGLNAAARRFAVRIFNEAKDSPTPFAAYATQFGTLFAAEREVRVMLYEMLFALALADGALHPAEDRLLKEALGPLRLEAGLYESLRGQAGPNLGELYAVLGIAPDASEAELKKAYRRAAREYHPDTIVSKGLPEEFTRFAEEKFKEVNRAYETIVKHRAG
jgi:DnaJ like chaperone protein